MNPEILKQLDIKGPRYTSYPSADRFVDAYMEDAHILSLTQRRLTRSSAPISVYIHIPFCESLCFFAHAIKS